MCHNRLKIYRLKVSEYAQILSKNCILPCILLWLMLLSIQVATASNPDNTAQLRFETDSLIQLSENENDQKLAIQYAERAIQIATSLKDPLLIARANQRSGVAWRRMGDYLESETRLTLARELYESLEMQREVHILLRELSETFRASISYPLAINLGHRAYDYFRQKQDSIEMALCLNRIAAIRFEMFFFNPDYVGIYESIEPSVTAFRGAVEKHPELYALSQQTQAYIDSTLAISRKINQHEVTISTNIIQATLYYAEYKTSMAIVKYNETIDLMLETGYTEDMPLALIHLSRIYGVNRLNQPELAIEMASEALEMARQNNINIYILMASIVLHDNYLALDNYKEAYKYYRITKEILELSQRNMLAIKISEKEFTFQLLQKETEIALRRKQLIRTGIMGGMLILTVSVFVIILVIKNREKWKLLEELNNKNLVIKRQNRELTESNSSKDRLFSIIAHDLKSPFQAIMGYSELLRGSCHNYGQEDIQKFTDRIYVASVQTMDLLNNLLDWARLQRDQVFFNPKRLELKLVTEKIISICKPLAESKSIEIINQTSPGMMVFADEDMLTTILRNLTCNAIKFTKQGGRVYVSASIETPFIIVSVKDNGIGIDSEHLKTLFLPGSNGSTKDTSNEKGTGLGLVLCKEFVEKHEGEIWVDSTLGKGSIFSFSLPIK